MLLSFCPLCGLAEVVLPLGVAHVAGFEELLVHSECAGERMRRVSRFGHLEVLVEQWAILRVNTVVYDFVCTLNRALSAQVGNTMFGDDDLDGVL